MHKNIGLLAYGVCIALGAFIVFAGCSEQRRMGRLTAFAQKGPQFLIELTDKEGRDWKVNTVETPNAITTFVIDSTGKVVLTTIVFPDTANRRRSIVFVDSAEKDEALGILDRRFLSAIANQSDAYRTWLEKYGVFTYGTTQRTASFEVSGGLGASTVHVKGTTIVGQLEEAKCHCYELGYTCGGLPSTFIACINKICDLINCVTGIINGSGSNCAQEGSDAEQTCALAAGQPQ